jgi:hypothetical protein
MKIVKFRHILLKRKKGIPHELKYRISFTTERNKCKINN